jgi:hypothetical protein
MTPADKQPGIPVSDGPSSEAASAAVHPAGGSQASVQQRARKSLTPSQRRWLIGLAAAFIIVFGFFTFSVVTNLDDARVTFLITIAAQVPTFLLATWILSRGRKDHIAIARHAESIYRQALIEDPGNKALARSLLRSLRMQSDFAQAKRRALYFVPVMAMLFGIPFLGAFAGIEYGCAAAAAAVVVPVVIIGAIRTAVRVVPVRRMPASVRNAARADLWHLTAAWLTIAGVVAAVLAIPSLGRGMPGGGPIVFTLIAGFAAVTLIAAYFIRRWMRAAPDLVPDMSKAAEDGSATQASLTGNDLGSSRGSQWAAELQESTPTSRTIRINLAHVHILEVCVSRWRDTVKLDGEVVVGKLRSDLFWSDRGNRYREPTNVASWYIVYIDDGYRRLPSEITVTKNHVRFSRRIIKISLLVAGSCLYSE